MKRIVLIAEVVVSNHDYERMVSKKETLLLGLDAHALTHGVATLCKQPVHLVGGFCADDRPDVHAALSPFITRKV